MSTFFGGPNDGEPVSVKTSSWCSIHDDTEIVKIGHITPYPEHKSGWYVYNEHKGRVQWVQRAEGPRDQ